MQDEVPDDEYVVLLHEIKQLQTALAAAREEVAAKDAEIERLQEDVISLNNMAATRLARIAELEAVVGRLPKYADTGEPLMPGMLAHWQCGVPGNVASYRVTEVRLYEPEPSDDTEWEPHEWPNANALGVPADGSVSEDGNGGYGPLPLPDDFGIYSTAAAAQAAQRGEG